MRIPSDLTADPSPRRRHRARWWLIGIVVVIIILLVSLRSLAGLYTDSLWFSSVDLHNVFSTLLAIKLGLFGVFGAIFFAILWVNLVVCDRIAGHDVVLAQDDELVRRYQQFVRPYSGRIYVGLAFVLALIGASGTVGQWNNWILFLHGGNFGVTDPQFHKDIGFYVFDLPFMTFVVDWTLAILIVTLAVSLVFHYFNGGIQPQRGLPRVRPPVKAHISVLLALIALDKAAGYVLQRWSLVNSQDGYVNGAGYTDVHARLPAETLLIYVSIFAAVILLFNIRRQGWTFPVLAIGIWAFVALVVGIIYPALLQALKVTPAQSSLEAPYIQRNITATRDAYNLNNVQVQQFPANTTISASQTVVAAPTIDNIRQWDPDPTISLQTFQRLQGIKSYYSFPSLGVDRYTLSGQRTPVLIGVRDISAAGVPSPSWVNTHLQYTHGNGAAVALSNQTTSNSPVFSVQDVPSVVLERDAGHHPAERLLRPGRDRLRRRRFQATRGRLSAEERDEHREPLLRDRRRPAVVDLHPGRLRPAAGGLQPPHLEPDHQQVAHHVHPRPGLHGADGGAIPHLRPRSLRGHQQRPRSRSRAHRLGRRRLHHDAQLRLLAERRHPAGGGREQPARELQLRAQLGEGRDRRLLGKDDVLRRRSEGPDPAGLLGGLPEHVHPDIEDAGLAAGAPALPARHLLHPVRHLRALPPGAARQQFYAASNAWQLSPTAGAGPQSQALLAQNTYNNQGQLVSTTPARMSPQYQVYSLPGTAPDQQVFTVSDGFVPAAQTNLSGNNQNFNLTAFMIGLADPGQYGKLKLYEVPQGTAGPANADAEISANKTVSSDITLLDQHGSEVLLGETLMVPIGNSMVYLRPLYASPTTNPQPQLQYVIGVLGKNVQIDSSLSATLSDLLQTTVTLPSGSGLPSTGTVPAAVAGLLQQAQTDYNNALAALKAAT